MEEEGSIGLEEGEGGERELYGEEEEEGENDLVVLDPSHVSLNLVNVCSPLYFSCQEQSCI